MAEDERCGAGEGPVTQRVRPVCLGEGAVAFFLHIGRELVEVEVAVARQAVEHDDGVRMDEAPAAEVIVGCAAEQWTV